MVDLLADSAADVGALTGGFSGGFCSELFFVEWRILRTRLLAADFSSGIHDLSLSPRKIHCKIHRVCGAILQACRTGCDPNGQWSNTKFSTGMLLVLTRVLAANFNALPHVFPWNGSCFFQGLGRGKP